MKASIAIQVLPKANNTDELIRIVDEVIAQPKPRCSDFALTAEFPEYKKRIMYLL